MRRRRKGAALRLAVCVLALSGAAASKPITIPEQDLRAALDEYIRLTKIQLVYQVSDLAGRRSHAVANAASTEQALDVLLAGTGLLLQRDGSGAVAVYLPKQAASAAPLSAAPPDFVWEPPETIVVNGFRASLDKSLDEKRAAIGVRDTILAENIGKYPTSNIAESLVRIPGIIIVRDTRTDEGKSVTIRGLGAEYSIVTINGNPVRIVTGTSVGFNNRSVDIDGLDADLFTRVDFYKSPRPQLDEGGIGGVIDMRTPHPFDAPGTKAVFSVGYSLNTYRSRAMPRGSLQFSHISGHWGMLMALTLSKNAYQLMGSETAGWAQSRNAVGDSMIATTFDFGPRYGGFDPRADIGTYTPADIEHAYIPRFLSRQHLELEDRTRYGALLSLQYKVDDRWDVSLDVLASHMSDRRSEYTLGAFLRSTETTAAGWTACQAAPEKIGTRGCNGVVLVAPKIDRNNNLYGTFADVGWVNENRWYDGDDYYLNATANARYQANDRMGVTAAGGFSGNRASYSDNRIYFYMYNTTVNYDPSVNNKFPTVWTAADMTDARRYSNPAVDANLYKENDSVRFAKVTGDIRFDTGVSIFDHVTAKLGLSLVTSQKTNDAKSNGAAVMNEPRADGRSIAAMAIGEYAIDRLPVTDFLGGIRHGERVMNWATVPRSFYETLHMNDILKRQESSRGGLYDVSEQVLSAFFSIDSAGEVWGRRLRIEAGVRYADTRLTGSNYSTSRDAAGAIVYGPKGVENVYDDVLPSVGLSYELADDVLARASFGEAITRPSLGAIAQGTTIVTRFGMDAQSGNSKLKPLKSKNVDLGIEWYFSPGAVVSLGLFHKDLKNLLSSGTEVVTFGSLNLPWSSLDPGVFGTVENPNLPIRLSRPVNMNPMTVQGIELYYQHPFSFLPEPYDGLGTMLNFTYTAGATGGQGTGFTANSGAVYKMQINGLSTYTYGATGYYDKAPYSLRLTYSWHSKATGSANYYNSDLLLWTQARGSLDCTVGYRLSDLVQVRLDATNLLNADEYAFLADGTGGRGGIAAGAGASRVNFDYYHGTTLTLSVRGTL